MKQNNVIEFPRQSENPEDDVVAAGPITAHTDGLRPMRVVLRDLSDAGYPKYAVHDEYFDEKTGEHQGYGVGHYFEYGGGRQGDSGALFLEALADWMERVSKCKSLYSAAVNVGRLRRVTSK